MFAQPASDSIIERIITMGAGTNVMFRTEKRPPAVAVNGYRGTAGPSGLQGETVTVRA